jgi:hypothetical protein
MKSLNYKVIEKPGPKIKNIFNDHKKTNLLDPMQSSGIYQITCETCNKKYIGQTSRSIETRTEEHLDSVNMGGRNYRKTWIDLKQNSTKDLACGFLQHIAGKSHSTDRSKVKILETSSTDTLDIKETLHIQNAGKNTLMNIKKGPLFNTKTFNLYAEMKNKQSLQHRNQTS